MRDRKRRPVRYPPGEVLLALYRRRGPVINSGLGARGYTYLLGPEANKFVFANADAFSWQEAFQVLVPVDGPTALVVSDGADHRRRRSVVAPALHHRPVSDYVPIIAANASPIVTGHSRSLAKVTQVILATGTRLLLTPAKRAEARELTMTLEPDQYFTRPPGRGYLTSTDAPRLIQLATS